MTIEGTILSDILTSAEGMADRPVRTPAQEFASFLDIAALGAVGNAVAAVDTPTADVGKPTPDGESGPSPADPAAQALAEDDQQAAAPSAEQAEMPAGPTDERALGVLAAIAQRLGLKQSQATNRPTASDSDTDQTDTTAPGSDDKDQDTKDALVTLPAMTGQAVPASATVAIVPAMLAGQVVAPTVSDANSDANNAAEANPQQGGERPAAINLPAAQKMPPMPVVAHPLVEDKEAGQASAKIEAAKPGKGDASPAAVLPSSQPDAGAQQPIILNQPADHFRHQLAMAPAPAPAAHHASAAAQQALSDLIIDHSADAQWIDRLAQDIQTLTKGDRREAHLRLHPEELGSLSIKVEVEGQRTRVHFTVDTPAAQALIADAAPRLTGLVESRGLKLDQASVDLGGNSTGREGHGERAPEPFQFDAPRPSASAAAAARLKASMRAFERYA